VREFRRRLHRERVLVRCLRCSPGEVLPTGPAGGVTRQCSRLGYHEGPLVVPSQSRGSSVGFPHAFGRASSRRGIQLLRRRGDEVSVCHLHSHRRIPSGFDIPAGKPPDRSREVAYRRFLHCPPRRAISQYSSRCSGREGEAGSIYPSVERRSLRCSREPQPLARFSSILLPPVAIFT